MGFTQTGPVFNNLPDGCMSISIPWGNNSFGTGTGGDVPEAASLALFGAGLADIGFMRRGCGA